MRRGHQILVRIGLILVASIAGLGAAANPPKGVAPGESVSSPSLAEAPPIERQTLQRLLAAQSWPRRAVAAVRLERYRDAASRDMLTVLLADDAWQVRSFAVRSLARRAEPQADGWLDTEVDPRVVRTALRHRYTIDGERLERGVHTLLREDDLDRRLLGVEIAAASGNAALLDDVKSDCKTIIHRMNRAEGGSLSPRLAALTGRPDLRRHYRWKQWLLKAGRSFQLRAAYALPDGAEGIALSRIAQVDAAAFGRLEQYMQELGKRDLDIAIVIDCTASMFGELSEVQGDVDDLMLFLGDVLRSARVGVIAYRDRREAFETQGWDFTSDIDEARRHLWQLTAEGGGDSPEAVFPALKLAFTQLDWKQERQKVLVVVGDGPPHVGFGAQCVDLARRGAEIEIITHAIEADGKPVDHFAEIARAGGGRCIALDKNESLIAEITGLSIGDRFEEEFRDFFQIYLELCR